jgi:site-specific recombinase XerD
MSDLIPQLKSTLPKVLGEAGEEVSSRVILFFTAEIRNPNTKKAYARAVRRFFQSARRGLDLSDIEPPHVAAYVEEDDRARATVKQNLAAIRRLFDYLVSGGALSSNPAAPVKGPKMSNPEGKTPVLNADETRELLDSIVATEADKEDVGRLRDRALTA